MGEVPDKVSWVCLQAFFPSSPGPRQGRKRANVLPFPAGLHKRSAGVPRREEAWEGRFTIVGLNWRQAAALFLQCMFKSSAGV
eukprot:1084931-Pelagomonas_calceolata.AAC.2